MPATTCTRCIDLETTHATERREQGAPTNWWHCRQCGHLDRYRGMTDQACLCGAWYNASGQRLRDNWMDNPSNFNDDIDDLEGYELAGLARDERYNL